METVRFSHRFILERGPIPAEFWQRTCTANPLRRAGRTWWRRTSRAAWNLVLASGKDELLNVIATELHSARFHQTEALIALLLCEFQNRPDWVYLTTYGNAEMKGAAKAIASGEFSALTKGMVSTAEQFIKAAVFANWDLSGTDAAELWTKSIQDIAWLIGYAAERFTKRSEERRVG